MKDQLDIVAVFTMLASLIWSPALSAVIGPYAAIVIASTLGAAWNLAGRPPESRWSAVFFFVRVNATAILLTVTICNLLETYVFHQEVKWSLVPVAFAIGWIGDDWPKVFGWLTSFGKRIAMRWAEEKGGTDK